MRSLINEDLRQGLCEQISHERYNASVYMCIGGFLRNKGLDKLANHFIGHIDEENGHARQIFDFLTDLNAQVDVRGVDGVSVQHYSILDIARLYLEREINTTESLTELKQMAIQFNDSVSEEFLRKMIEQQRNELAEASTFMDNAELCGEDWYRVKVWNDSLEV